MRKHLIRDSVSYLKVLNIDLKGNMPYLDKNGVLKFDLYSYQLTDEKQIEVFGKVVLSELEVENTIVGILALIIFCSYIKGVYIIISINDDNGYYVN